MRGQHIKRIVGVSRRSGSTWLWTLFFFPMGLVALSASVYLLFITEFESDLWFAPLGVVIEPFMLFVGVALTLVAGFRFLQFLGAVGVVYLRPFEDGSALIASWWLVRRGHGVVVDRHSKIRLQLSEDDNKMLGWTRGTGISVYMDWKISRTGDRVSWPTPFVAAPDATKRIHSALKKLPEPTHDSLDTCAAALADPLPPFFRLK